ncbi:DUF4747 family protein [Polyangium spumosum]|uniref:DUF4747 family protein n=1 Tax=Polyangium spumosum TaxID=889282 RepID=A0A6N7PTM3_9BACT|nr:DUF4747 family protein [Polyangium spumosum]MRG95592.1 DUF4747 family protein [Polyangium spumosum]
MRPKRMQVAVLNITTHPHTPAQYIELFLRAKQERVVGLAHGDRHAIVSSFSKSTSNDIELWTGHLNSFVDFDPKAPWLNVERGEAAAPNEVASVQLPEDLKPSMKQAFFAFAPQSHRFVFELDSGLGAHSVCRAMRLILNNKKVRGELPEVTVTIEQERETLERIFEMQTLKHLRIMVTRPNPDDFGDEDEEIERRLERQRARKLTLTLDSEKGQGLTPDDETRKLARLAMSNGRVFAEGVGPKGPQKISTENHPLIGTTLYNAVTTLKDVAFVQAAKEVLTSVFTKVRK